MVVLNDVALVSFFRGKAQSKAHLFCELSQFSLKLFSWRLIYATHIFSDETKSHFHYKVRGFHQKKKFKS